MSDQELLERITSDPEAVGGRPRARGTRLTVRYIVGLLAASATVDEIQADHPGLSREDLLACLRYAAEKPDHDESTAVPVSLSEWFP